MALPDICFQNIRHAWRTQELLKPQVIETPVGLRKLVEECTDKEFSGR
ncbi:hypothetical protein E2C01_039318 [Portunus trituberculatus]|uniref:Uncharacterized protein n=1 Tax=Portunus trituberculatus TaxID=210409 RepID=A0A5B7FKE1_PORTR|nr:hypothetical protein [Portunus trituberculatus]